MNTATDNLPASVLTKRQRKAFRYNHPAKPLTIIATVRHDDECGNGHNTFSITASIFGPDRYPGEETVEHATTGKKLYCHSGGCCHGEVAKYFPELAPLIKYHLCSTDEPLHYIQNTIYHAGDRDHNGLRAGERRHSKSGRTGLPPWSLEAIQAPGVLTSDTPTGQKYAGQETIPLYLLETLEDFPADKAPPVPVLRWIPSYTIGEGKKRELNHARSSAIWPEATDEQLSAEPAELRAMLEARHPQLMRDFRAAVESLGFVY